MRRHLRAVVLAIVVVISTLATAQTLLPGHYIGYATNSTPNTPLELFVGLNGDIAAKYGERISRQVRYKPNGALTAHFSAPLRFRGMVSSDGTAVDGQLFVPHPHRRHGPRTLHFHLSATHEATPIRLTGMTMWMAHPDGYFTENTGMAWDTRWGALFNVYLFTGTIASPIFLNTGDTDASLDPNQQLFVGSQTIYFSGEYPFEGTLAMNLYFNHEPGTRITALVPTDGSHDFSVVANGVQTFAGGPFDRVELSAGTLSFLHGDFRVILTDFQVIVPRVDLVGPNDTIPPYPAEDTTGRFTVTVIPEAWAIFWERRFKKESG